MKADILVFLYTCWVMSKKNRFQLSQQQREKGTQGHMLSSLTLGNRIEKDEKKLGM